MNEFKKNHEMELLLQAKQNQPKLFEQLSPTTKMSLGIYESTKPSTNGLTTDDRLRLRGLKQSVARDVLSPQERIIKSIEISNLEERIGDK